MSFLHISIGPFTDCVAAAILTAWFYGSMTDSWGRRRTMKLSLAGIFIFQALSLGLIAAVPRIQVEAVSVAGVALFVGGGVGVTEAAVVSNTRCSLLLLLALITPVIMPLSLFFPSLRPKRALKHALGTLLRGKY